MPNSAFASCGFKILRPLGSGGTAHVYLATAPEYPYPIALKIPLENSEEFLTTFLSLIRREYKLIGDLRFPGLVRTLRLNESRPPLPYLVLEYCPYYTLEKAGKIENPITLFNILSSIAIDLFYLELDGLGHGDLKPHNIFLGGPTSAYSGDTAIYSKLSDFSLALKIDENVSSRLGVGTIGYMAPETIDSGKLDHRADLFALGIIAYLLSTGKHPFLDAESDPMRINALIKEHYPTPPSDMDSALPREFSDLVISMLSKEPEERPADGYAICERLEKVGAKYPFRKMIRPKHLLELSHNENPEETLKNPAFNFDITLTERLLDYSGDNIAKLRSILEINFTQNKLLWHNGKLESDVDDIIWPQSLRRQEKIHFHALSYSRKKLAVFSAIMGGVNKAETIGLIRGLEDKKSISTPLLFLLKRNLSPLTIRRFTLPLARLAGSQNGRSPLAAGLYIKSENLEEGYSIIWDTANDLINQNEVTAALDLLNSLTQLCYLKKDIKKLRVVLMKKADTEKLSGDIIRAEKAYLEIIESYADEPPDKLLAESYKDLGDLYRIKQDYEPGIRVLEKAQSIYTAIGDQLELSHTLNNIGNIYAINNQLDKAYSYFRQTLHLQRKLNTPADIALTINNIAVIFCIRGRFDRAGRLFNLSLRLSRQLGNAGEIARTLNNCGYIYNEIGQFDKALDYLKESLEINRRIGNKKELLYNLDNLTRVMISAGRLKESLDFLREGMNLSSELEDIPHSAIFAGNMATVQKRMGHYGKSLENVNRALEIGSKMDDRTELVNWLITLADIYIRINDNDKALSTINQAYDFAVRGDYRKALIPIHIIKGTIENQIKHFELAENLAQETKAIRDQNLTKLKKASLLLKQGDLVGTGNIMSGLVNNFREGTSDIENAVYFNLFATYYFESGNLEMARLYSEKGFHSAVESALLPELTTAAINSGKIYAKMNEYESAYNYYRKAIEGLKTMVDDIKDETLRKSFLSDGKIASLAGEVKKLSQLLAKRRRADH